MDFSVELANLEAEIDSINLGRDEPSDLLEKVPHSDSLDPEKKTQSQIRREQRQRQFDREEQQKINLAQWSRWQEENTESLPNSASLDPKSHSPRVKFTIAAKTSRNTWRPKQPANARFGSAPAIDPVEAQRMYYIEQELYQEQAAVAAQAAQSQFRARLYELQTSLDALRSLQQVQSSTPLMYFVLDTCCLVEALETSLAVVQKLLPHARLVVPRVVFKELDGLKRGSQKSAVGAREAVRTLQRLLQLHEVWVQVQPLTASYRHFLLKRIDGSGHTAPVNFPVDQPTPFSSSVSDRDSVIGDKILRALRAAPSPITALTVAKSVGLVTAAEVNPSLYALEKKGLIGKRPSGQGQRWVWSCVSSATENVNEPDMNRPSPHPVPLDVAPFRDGDDEVLDCAMYYHCVSAPGHTLLLTVDKSLLCQAVGRGLVAREPRDLLVSASLASLGTTL
jgi:hypothetical protein